MATANSVRMKEADTAERELARKGKRDAWEKGEKRFENREKARSNRQKEYLEWRGQNTKLMGDALKTAGGIVTNDPVWYSHDPQLVRDVASLSYNATLGTTESLYPEEISVFEGNITLRETSKGCVPGLMILPFLSVLGSDSSQAQGAATIAARKIYAYVRHANSGSANYDAPDLMLFLFGMDGIYSALAHADRLYAMACQANNKNLYQYVSYIRACGINYEDLLQHLASYRARINVLKARANSLNIPNKFDFFSRHVWMSTKIFKDYNVTRSQEYMYVPHGLWAYDEKNNRLVCSVLNELGSNGNDGLEGNTTLGVMLDRISNALDSFITSESAGIMSGDVLKAYGEGNLVKLKMTELDPVVEVGYSEEVLTQIQGATLHGEYSDFEQFQIIQDTDGNIRTKGKISTDQFLANDVDHFKVPGRVYLETALYGSDIGEARGHVEFKRTHTIINMYKDDPTPDDNMVATRLSNDICISGAEFNASSGLVEVSTNFGSEIITGAKIVYRDGGKFKVSPTLRTIEIQELSTSTSGDMLRQDFKLVDLVARLLAYFDWAPIVYVMGVSSMGSYSSMPQQTGVMLYSNQELTNYAVIDTATLERMHRVAIMSLLDIF